LTEKPKKNKKDKKSKPDIRAELPSDINIPDYIIKDLEEEELSQHKPKVSEEL